jgi:hypothetical protein
MPGHDRSDASFQVANLIARYAELIDAGDFEGLAVLLGDAGVGAGDSPSLLTGKEALRKLFVATTRLYPDGTPGTKHVTTNLIIEIDEEAIGAQARSYFTVLQAVPGLPLQPILAGRYRDRFERTGTVWRFSERRYLIDLVGDVSRHMLTGLPK